jgi:hypothetical protein
MILYNITVIIDEGIEGEWLNWINQTFIPNAMSTNLLASSRLLKVLDSPNEGVTYCLQFITDNIGNYNDFKNLHAAEILDAHALEFKNKSVFFSSVMEFID